MMFDTFLRSSDTTNEAAPVVALKIQADNDDEKMNLRTFAAQMGLVTFKEGCSTCCIVNDTKYMTIIQESAPVMPGSGERGVIAGPGGPWVNPEAKA